MFRKQVLTDKNIEDMKNNALDSRSSFLKRTIHNLKSNKPALIGGMVLLALIVIGFAAPLLAPHDPLEVETSNRLLSPSLQYPLGTDHMGRCILSRLMYATRTSLITALIILAGNLAIGIPLGLIAGYVGIKDEAVNKRLCDIMSYVIAENDMVKTTLFNILSGKEKYDKGTIEWGKTIIPGYFNSIRRFGQSAETRR